jgi:hypothetical protein
LEAHTGFCLVGPVKTSGRCSEPSLAETAVQMWERHELLKKGKLPLLCQPQAGGKGSAFGMWQPCVCKFVLLMKDLEPGALSVFPGSPDSGPLLTLFHMGGLGSFRL